MTVKPPRKFTHEKLNSNYILGFGHSQAKQLIQKDEGTQTKLKCWLFGDSENIPVNKRAFLNLHVKAAFFPFLSGASYVKPFLTGKTGWSNMGLLMEMEEGKPWSCKTPLLFKNNS